MKITHQLIKSFFNHTCTPEEARAVAYYLTRNPKVAEKYISVDEWNAVSNVSSESDDFWEEQWISIQKKRTKPGKTILRVIRYAAAAMIVFMAGVGIYRFAFNNQANKLSPHNAIAQAGLKVVTNNYGEIQLLTLPDGSKVELLPGSQISYKIRFDNNKREIFLKGEATFQVAKDSLRPFTVYSGSISTTALGTKFRVIYSEAIGEAKVYLYEGKVVIQAYHNDKIQKAYLSPGDQLTYQIGEGISVQHELNFVSNKTTHPGKKPHEIKKHNAPSDLDKSNLMENAPAIVPMWYRFDKEALSNVFDQLADIYKVKITYQRADLMNKYFIGKFEDTRSLRDILETITELNDLKVEKVSASHYIISKK